MKKNIYTRFMLPIIMLLIVTSCGKEGTVGPQGAQGPQGTAGTQGPKGDPGQNGTKFYSGNTAPAASIGVDGDFYINLANSILYGPKTSGSWGNGVSIKGAAGAAGTNGTNGTKIYSGNAAPSATMGVVGDFYFDLAAARLYGPKTADGWGNGVSLRGNSSGRSINSFSFTGLNPAVNATISEADKIITLNVPAGTVLTSLVPTIGMSDNATVSPASGIAQNFTQPVNYTVTAQDGSTQVYKVTVTVNKATTQVIDCGHLPSVLEDLGDGVDYIVKCNISLNSSSQVLTIKPGVTIQFDGADAGITVSGGAALNMVGTAAKPIVLEGTTNTPGAWTGIQISSNNILNQWEYVSVKNAGGGKYPAGLLFNDSAYFLQISQVSIKNCTFTGNQGYGIWDLDNNYGYGRVVFSAFQNNTFSGNTNAALNITIDDIGKLDATGHYGNNGQPYIEIHGSGGLHSNVTVAKLDVPYLVVGTIGLGQKMTVSPGVTFQFYTDAGFYLANTTATLIAKGTVSAPIKFIGYKPGVGYWLGLFLSNNDPQIALNYCIVDGAGSNRFTTSGGCSISKAAITFDSPCGSNTVKPLVTNSTITNSGGYGIIYGKNAVINFSNNTYSGNTLDNEKAL